VTVFNKRNALVGFLTLQALKHQRRSKQIRRKAPKIALFSLLGLASLVAAVGVVAVLLKRRGDDELPELEDDIESEIIGEYVTGGAEPIPAT
jgi:hypothetical protein